VHFPLSRQVITCHLCLMMKTFMYMYTVRKALGHALSTSHSSIPRCHFADPREEWQQDRVVACIACSWKSRPAAPRTLHRTALTCTGRGRESIFFVIVCTTVLWYYEEYSRSAALSTMCVQKYAFARVCARETLTATECAAGLYAQYTGRASTTANVQPAGFGCQ
jgi:hypothetical protein